GYLHKLLTQAEQEELRTEGRRILQDTCADQKSQLKTKETTKARKPLVITDNILHQQASTQPGEKPHEYNQCGKATGRNSNHFMPKRNHTGEKCSECKEYGKVFGYPSSLRIHV
ncbi:hypothetical protein DBR06_SOUSAS5710035, partial [Sousa chinensis]